MSTDLIKAYKEEIKRQTLRQSRIGCIIAFLIMPTGVLLDYFVYPDHLFILAIIRILCSLCVGLVLLLHSTSFFHNHSYLLPFTWPVFVNIAICMMILMTDGAPSVYYAGLNIVLIGIIFILPLSLLESLLFCAITVFLYLITCIAAGNIQENFNIFYSNFNFLALTGGVSCLVSHVNSKNSFNQFRLSFELDQKNQQLTRLEKLRTSFFANISHELRTPLTLILSPIQDMLRQDAHLPARIEKVLQTTYTNGLRLLKLVNDLLDVIRIEEGKSQLNLKPLLVDVCLDELVESISLLSNKKHVTIEKSLRCPTTRILADVNAIEKIIFNLLHNAIKFSDTNSVIRLSSRMDKNSILVSVSDNGIGIEPAELPFIFDRFRQADSSTTRKYEGSGLGLSLVKDLTEQLNGKIDVASTPGEGTTFTLSFPIHGFVSDRPALPVQTRDNQDSLQRLYRLANRSGMLHLGKAAASEHDQGEDNRPQVHSPHTLLVVEDEADLREYLVAALESTYPVMQASDGDQAWQTINEHKPSLVILDLMIPRIDGLELCARIKKSDDLRNTKIILLTARIDEDAKLTALDNGADDFLTKPFSTLELRTRIRNLLRTTDYQRELIETNNELKNTLNELKETQAQLIQSEKTNALEYLSAGILHEINNPLNYSLTALQLAGGLPEAKESALLAEIFEDINEGMCRIKDIVTDLQTFAHPSPVDKQGAFRLADALKTALNFTSQDAEGVSIINDIASDHYVVGSKNHIVQVLVNLITNALKATRAVEKQRKGELRISSELAGGRILVKVRDNGTGIEGEILNSIFDPFFTTRDVGEGMGLGLSVSQTIVKAHNGSLRATSQPGEWTEFCFDLEPAAAA